MKYKTQVDKSHYSGKAYRSVERWVSYWHQIDLVRRTNTQTLLEVGIGDGVVARELSETDISVTTVDIAKDLHPDVMGSVTELPFQDKSFDTVLAAEILEHIKYEDVPKALREISRVARKYVIISIPHPGYVFSFVLKIPLLQRIALFTQIPFFWETHTFSGEHYWELGKRGYSVCSFKKLAHEAGLSLITNKSYADDPAHKFFLFSV